MWLGDDECWQSFANKICAAFSSQASIFILRVFLKDVPIQQALLNSLPAFVAFSRIANYWSEKWKTVKEPVFTWQQLEAKLPGHPEVETFLRSSNESFSYAKFASIADARYFAAELHRTGPTKGFSVSVKANGVGKSARCDIVKNRSHFDDVNRRFAAQKAESVQLSKLLQKLNAEWAKRVAAVTETPSEITPDEVRIVSPPKRVKLDVPLIELD